MGQRRSRDEPARSRSSSFCIWTMRELRTPGGRGMRSPSEATVAVKFWGVRGSIASDGEEITGTGGNTACVEMRCGPHLLLFDAGTGLRKAGRALAGEG